MLLAFLIGLAIGILCLLVYHWRFDRKLRSLIQDLEPVALQVALPLTSRLTGAISLHKQRSVELEHALETQKHILHQAPIGYLQVDAEDRLVWCNAEAYQLLQIHTWAATKPRLLLEVVRSYELDQLITQTRQTQQPTTHEWNLHLSHLTIAPSTPALTPIVRLRGRAFPLPNQQVGVFLEDRQEVLQLQQHRDQAFSDLAHELKTPLTSIRLVMETIQNRLDPSLHHWADRVIQEVIRMSTLVQDLLDLTQLERGADTCLQCTTLDLAELIHSVCHNLDPLAQTRQIQLVYQGPTPLMLWGDYSRLYRVMANLLDNSIRYSPLAGTVVIQTQIRAATAVRSETIVSPARPIRLQRCEAIARSPTWVQIDVIDSGQGFADVDLPHIFERFYRADPARTRTDLTRKLDQPPLGPPASPSWPTTETRLAGPGEVQPTIGGSSGLGLAIVREIVEAHQGIVRASNHPETGGAWLQVLLPQSPPSSPPLNPCQ